MNKISRIHGKAELKSQSTLLLSSLQVWWIWMRQLRYNIFWISRMSTWVIPFILQLFVTLSLSNFKSLLTHNWEIPSFQSNSRHKYISHISAWRAPVTPILRTKPLIHLPLASRSKPSIHLKMITSTIFDITGKPLDDTCVIIRSLEIFLKIILFHNFHKFQRVDMKVVFHLVSSSLFQGL